MHVNPDSVYEATSPIISIGKLSVCFLSNALKTDDSYNNCYFVFAQRKQLRCQFVKTKKLLVPGIRCYSDDGIRKFRMYSQSKIFYLYLNTRRKMEEKS